MEDSTVPTTEDTTVTLEGRSIELRLTMGACRRIHAELDIDVLAGDSFIDAEKMPALPEEGASAEERAKALNLRAAARKRQARHARNVPVLIYCMATDRSNLSPEWVEDHCYPSQLQELTEVLIATATASLTRPEGKSARPTGESGSPLTGSGSGQ